MVSFYNKLTRSSHQTDVLTRIYEQFLSPSIYYRTDDMTSVNPCPAIPPDSSSISTQKLQLFFKSADLKWFMGPDFFLLAAYAILKQTKVDKVEFEASTSAGIYAPEPVDLRTGWYGVVLGPSGVWIPELQHKILEIFCLIQHQPHFQKSVRLFGLIF